jgi:hypothetical protein
VQSFFAVEDGSGPWAPIVPNGSTYAFDLVQPTAQVAFVTNDSGGFRTTVYQATAQEIAALAASECTLYPNPTSRCERLVRRRRRRPRVRRGGVVVRLECGRRRLHAPQPA